LTILTHNSDKRWSQSLNTNPNRARIVKRE